VVPDAGRAPRPAGRQAYAHRRTGGHAHRREWGGEPVFIDPKEVYQSAERGVVDGINMGVATFSSWKLWDVMPHMINAQLFYGNVMYSMNKEKFDALAPEHQEAILQAGRDAAEWIKPQYEAWINEQIGLAVMKGGGSAAALPAEERLRLIESAADGWNDQMDEACGPELAGKLRALFEEYAG
jgi:TRAP-type C4-dicarboxylate transport system substrate-binding protein